MAELPQNQTEIDTEEFTLDLDLKTEDGLDVTDDGSTDTLDTKVCETCKWYETYTGACCNGDSDYCADHVSSMNSCENWDGGTMTKNVEYPYCHVREKWQPFEPWTCNIDYLTPTDNMNSKSFIDGSTFTTLMTSTLDLENSNLPIDYFTAVLS